MIWIGREEPLVKLRYVMLIFGFSFLYFCHISFECKGPKVESQTIAAKTDC